MLEIDPIFEQGKSKYMKMTYAKNIISKSLRKKETSVNKSIQEVPETQEEAKESNNKRRMKKERNWRKDALLSDDHDWMNMLIQNIKKMRLPESN